MLTSTDKMERDTTEVGAVMDNIIFAPLHSITNPNHAICSPLRDPIQSATRSHRSQARAVKRVSPSKFRAKKILV